MVRILASLLCCLRSAQSCMKASSLPKSNEPIKSPRLNNYHTSEAAVRGCITSLWCSLQALLKHILSSPPSHKHTVICNFHPPWHHAQPCRFSVSGHVCLLGNVRQWHANDIGWLKHRKRAASLLTRGSAIEVSWLMCFHSVEMIELDGDEERISSQGRYAERDIVQVQRIPKDSTEKLFTQRSIFTENDSWL